MASLEGKGGCFFFLLCGKILPSVLRPQKVDEHMQNMHVFLAFTIVPGLIFAKLSTNIEA